MSINLDCKPPVQDPASVVSPCLHYPDEVLRNIFSHLKMVDLRNVRLVCKFWKQWADDPSLITSLQRKEIYDTFAFNKRSWERCGGEEFVIDEDEEKELASIPDDVVKLLSSPGTKKEYMLFRIPKGLTIKKIGELAKRYFPKTIEGYYFIWNPIITNFNPIITNFGDDEVQQSYWALMTTDVLPDSRSKKYIEQKTIVAAFSKKAAEKANSLLTDSEKLKTVGNVPNYEVPKAIEAITGIFTKYFATHTSAPGAEVRLFSDNPRTYTRCQEDVDDWLVAVGGFSPSGLIVGALSDRDVIGVAALRKF